ncbi:hypothetical protein M231_02521 [Tremella mesenterica]|uniref:Uncharacterized protein n=1 Tax=Tremella mesenterica TaxID=5217 RepID=A0A4V1M4G1_TREME|nr:uncharacterized protein TREMEDRAFT_40475 [Tremella mesenterica DSM 1558]EIW67336.1 hypothetical protein TREMEDRAFT_40475 [Tremella mesenterica DSM 1558]RXK40247.1 hypothetical protein M231_02521 [Tremella mesenterica]
MSTVPKHRQLPDKESKLFKELIAQYEVKQYKKCIKAADTILKKLPNHGETLALKALSLHSSLPMPPTVASLPKQEEAEAMARTAVKKDITSHITWHVLGILAKNRKDWEEASRAFAMARKQDSENVPVLRDIMSLYMHTRQYPAAVAARHHYLLMRPQIRSSWLGLMIAHDLNGDIEEALQVYDGYVSMVYKEGMSPSEHSQVCLYVVRLCMEAGLDVQGLDRLEKAFRDGVVSPRGEATKLKAEMLLRLGKKEEAEESWRVLLEQNSDSHDNYKGFLRTRGLSISPTLDDTSREKVAEILAGFAQSYPRSSAPKRMQLDVLQGDAFRSFARPYIITGLERGIPSLFVDVKGVYEDVAKMQAVGELVADIVQQLEKESSLEEDTTEPPTTLLWAYYYFALHLSHPLHPEPNHSRSLELLEIALKHTPTLPELYMAKAIVLKRSGDPLTAAYAMEEARSLDLQDRFLNSKAAKYWYRAGQIQKAEELLALFSKKGAPVVTDQTDLQCLWMMQEEGDAYRRTGNLALALKRYQSVFTTFTDYDDDQFDFHTYCMRRMTLSSYKSLIKYEDQLRSHPAYIKSAREAIEIYMRISDDPSLTEEHLTPEEEAERKKAAKKAQKAEQKARKAAAATSDGKKEDQPIPDDDPTGEKLLKTETPLEDALKIWKPLEKFGNERIEVWTMGYEIYIRKKMWLAALRCLKEAYSIDPEDPTLHKQLYNFKHLSQSTDIPPMIKETISTVLPSLISGDLEDFNKSYLDRHSNSPTHILSAAQALHEIQPTSEEIITILNRLISPDVRINIQVILRALEFLQSAVPDVVEEYRGRCRERFPSAWIFSSLSEQVVRAEQMALSVGSGEEQSKADV